MSSSGLLDTLKSSAEETMNQAGAKWATVEVAAPAARLLCLLEGRSTALNSHSVNSNRSSMQNTNVAPHEQILSLILGFWQAMQLD